jgi:hypothetical protein
MIDPTLERNIAAAVRARIRASIADAALRAKISKAVAAHQNTGMTA